LQWGDAWEGTRDWETEEERFRRTGKKHRGGGGVSRPGSPIVGGEDEKEGGDGESEGEGGVESGRRDYEEKEVFLEYALWEQ